MNEMIAEIMKDWPLLGVLLVILIGLYRLAGRTLTIMESHLEMLITTLEKIADEIAKTNPRDRDS